jgi:hypothetical protein
MLTSSINTSDSQPLRVCCEGSHNMLNFMGRDFAPEFFYFGPLSLISCVHLNNVRGTYEPGPNH